jgi:hypothetical protein
MSYMLGALRTLTGLLHAADDLDGVHARGHNLHALGNHGGRQDGGGGGAVAGLVVGLRGGLGRRQRGGARLAGGWYGCRAGGRRGLQCSWLSQERSKQIMAPQNVPVHALPPLSLTSSPNDPQHSNARHPWAVSFLPAPRAVPCWHARLSSCPKSRNRPLQAILEPNSPRPIPTDPVPAVTPAGFPC